MTRFIGSLNRIAVATVLLGALGCGRTCPASNVSSVSNIAVGRVGAPREVAIAHSEAELGAIFAKAVSLTSANDSPLARMEFISQTDFAQFDVAVVNVDDSDDFQGTLRNATTPDVAPFFDGPGDHSLVAVVGPHCGPIHDTSCGGQLVIEVIPRAVVFRVPKGTVLRVMRCTQDCPTKCGPHS